MAIFAISARNVVRSSSVKTPKNAASVASAIAASSGTSVAPASVSRNTCARPSSGSAYRATSPRAFSRSVSLLMAPFVMPIWRASADGCPSFPITNRTSTHSVTLTSRACKARRHRIRHQPPPVAQVIGQSGAMRFGPIWVRSKPEELVSAPIIFRNLLPIIRHRLHLLIRYSSTGDGTPRRRRVRIRCGPPEWADCLTGRDCPRVYGLDSPGGAAMVTQDVAGRIPPDALTEAGVDKMIPGLAETFSDTVFSSSISRRARGHASAPPHLTSPGRLIGRFTASRMVR